MYTENLSREQFLRPNQVRQWKQWKQWKRYTSQDRVPKQSCQGQTDFPEQQVITLPMYTRMMKVTVEAVPQLRENIN